MNDSPLGHNSIEDIAQNCRDIVVDAKNIYELIEGNPNSGLICNVDDLIENQETISENLNIKRMVLFGPFWSGIGKNNREISNLKNNLININASTWDEFITSADSEFQEVRNKVHSLEGQLDEIPWNKNSDTRKSYFYALEPLYTLIHLYNSDPIKYKDVSIGICLAPNPFSGYVKTRKQRSEFSISAIEIRTILELLKRGYRIPPICFITDVFQEPLVNYYISDRPVHLISES